METATLIHLLSDVELTARLCSEADDAVLYNEFVNRFHSELTERCIATCKRRLLDDQIGKDIAHRCFEKFRRYKSFSFEKTNIKDPHKAILVYLYRFAINLFNDHYNHTSKLQENGENGTYFAELLGAEASNFSIEELARKRTAAMQILSQLSKEERKVLLADLEYKRAHKYLPDQVVEELAKELSVEKSTIRKIRQRAKNKIKKSIHEG